MSGLIFIFICLAIGKTLTKYHDPVAIIRVLNLIVIRVAMPAMILDKIHSVAFSADSILPIATPWIGFIMTIIIIYLIKLVIPFSKPVTGCLIILCGTSNTSFVGLPIINAFLGPTALGTAIIVDQSNLILLFTVGIILANVYSGKSFNLKTIGINLLKYPPIIALIIALLSRPLPYHEYLQYSLTTFGQLLTPLAMISIGCTLKLPKDKSLIKLISVGMTIKLILLPLVMAGIVFTLFTHSSDQTITVSIMQISMAPMVIGAMIANDKNLQPELANFLTGIGIPLSFITVPLWYNFVTYLIT